MGNKVEIQGQGGYKIGDVVHETELNKVFIICGDYGHYNNTHIALVSLGHGGYWKLPCDSIEEAMDGGTWSKPSKVTVTSDD